MSKHTKKNVKNHVAHKSDWIEWRDVEMKKKIWIKIEQRNLNKNRSPI